MWFCGQTGLLFCGHGLLRLLLWSADGLCDWFAWQGRGCIGVCLSAGLWVPGAVLSPVSPARRWHRPDRPWTPPSPACGPRPPPPLPRLLPPPVAQAWDLHLHAPPRCIDPPWQPTSHCLQSLPAPQGQLCRCPQNHRAQLRMLPRPRTVLRISWQNK